MKVCLHGSMLVCLDGVWKTKSREKVSLGGSSVSCLLAVNRDLWAACESSIHIISCSSSSSSNALVITKVCSCCWNKRCTQYLLTSVLQQTLFSVCLSLNFVCMLNLSVLARVQLRSMLDVTYSSQVLTCFCSLTCLWPPCVADADIIFSSCGFFFFFSFFSSPNLSSGRMDR